MRFVFWPLLPAGAHTRERGGRATESTGLTEVARLSERPGSDDIGLDRFHARQRSRGRSAHPDCHAIVASQRGHPRTLTPATDSA